MSGRRDRRTRCPRRTLLRGLLAGVLAAGLGVSLWLTTVSGAAGVARAGSRAPDGTCGLCVLAPTGQALTLTGNGSVALPGANVIVDSAGDPAVTITGKGSLSAPSVGVVGTVKTSGGGSVADLTTGIVPIEDPLVALAVPSLALPRPVPSVNVNGNEHTAIAPGVYEQLSVNGNGSLTLEPGTYVIRRQFTATGSSDVSAKGVTLYLACSAYPTPCRAGERGASLTLTGSGSLDLTGPSDKCSPVAIFADRNNASQITLTGGANQILDGIVYAKSGALTLTGRGSALAMGGFVVVGTATLTGNGNVVIENGSPLSGGLALTLGGAPLSAHIGQTETLSATLTCHGKPLAGQPVTFATSGAGSHAATETTNPEGRATFSYEGVDVGAEQATASFSAPGIGVSSNPVGIEWGKGLPAIATAVSSPSVEIGDSVSDEATLGGGFSPTGKVSWKVYEASDTECKTPLNKEPLVAILSAGHARSPAFKPGQDGVFQFVATYEGDANNEAVSSRCGQEGEQFEVAKARPAISTSVSAATVELGGAASDTATVSGGRSPTGKVRWSVYAASDKECKTPLNKESLLASLSAGSATSPAFKPAQAGTYQFVATYEGDGNNEAVSTACGEESEQFTATKAHPAIATSVSAAAIEVGESASDKATLSGGLSPTGKVSWSVYAASDGECKSPLTKEPLVASLIAGSATSPAFKPAQAGTYQFVARYEGDANNEPASTKCGEAGEQVKVGETKAAPAIDLAATDVVQGSFYAEPLGAKSFLAAPGDKAAFGESFPTIDFNPPAGRITGEPGSGPNPTTRPFTDVTTDLIGDYAGTSVAEGNGVQAGVGSLESFDAVFTSSIVVHKAGQLTFAITSEDGFLLGFGGGATRVNGTYVNAPESNTSPFEGYSLVAANNVQSLAGPPETYLVTVEFPAAGSYPYELDYFSSSGQELSLTLALASANEESAPNSIFLGYADTDRPPKSVFPFPWLGSPGVVFDGCKPGCTPFDGGTIRVDNNTSAAETLGLSVEFSTCTYSIWPKETTLPAGEIAIFAQEAAGASDGCENESGEFDTSDIGPDKRDWAADCEESGVIGKVNLTVNGTTTTYTDTHQVLNTGGFDTGACEFVGAAPRAFDFNESEPWQSINVSSGKEINMPLPPAVTLALSPAKVGPDTVGQSQSFTVAAMNAGGHPVANLTVALHVNGEMSGSADNQILEATTNPEGNATFSYTGRAAETDALTANAFIEGLQEVSNTATLQWNIPVPGGASSGGKPEQAPPAVTFTAPATGAVVGSPTAVKATITPPSGESIASWKLLAQASQSGSTQSVLASGSGAPPATLGTFEPTLLPNGGYTLTVQATASGGGTGSASEPVTVLDEAKLGRYVTSYTDLTVPLGGIEVAVQRTYDSTNKNVGDFGVGWQLGLSDFKVSTNGPLGAGGWSAAPKECTLFGCTYAFHSSLPHTVTITEPSGAEEVFDLTPSGSFGPLFFIGSSAYTPKPGTRPLGSLADVNAGPPTYDFAGDLDSNIAGPIYEPTEFIFTSSNGTKYLLSTGRGLLDELSTAGTCVNFASEVVNVYTEVSESAIAGCSGGKKQSAQLTLARDGKGRITKVTEPDGVTSFSYAYDAAGDLEAVSFPSGEKDLYTYDAHHDLLTAKGPGHPTLTQTYGPTGRLESITDGDGNTVKVTTNPEEMTESLESPDGKLLTVMHYSPQGNATREERVGEGQTRTTSWTYDTLGDVLTKTDPLGHTSKAEYDGAGDLTAYTDPDGHTTKSTYNSLGEETSRTDALGNKTKETYNAHGELIGLSEPVGEATFEYGGADDVLARTSPLGRTTHYKYDASDELEALTLPSGHATTLTRNADGQITSSEDPLGRLTEFEYDHAGQLTLVKDPLGHTRKAAYNSEGELESSTDADGHTTKYAYDGAGRLTQITDALGGVVKMAYNKDGELESLTDPDGRERTYAYDAFGELIAESDPASGTRKYTYDADGRLVSSENALGQVVTRNYDADGNLTELIAPEGTSAYTYDADQRPVKMVDKTGTTTWEYNADGRLAKTASPEGSIEYGYSGSVERSTVAIDGMKPIEYRYNSDGDLIELIDPEGNATKFEYDADDRLAAVSDPNGQITSYEYDAAGAKSSVRSTGHGKAPLRSFSYGRDGNGSVTSLESSTGASPAVVTHYGYDALGRLSEEETGGHLGKYEYDAAGNITKLGESAYSYNSSSGLLSAIGAEGVEHDAAGHVTKLGSQSFSWDALGDLTAATVAGKSSSYSYNGNGMRVGASGANTGSYLWSGGALVSDGKNVYLRGPAGAIGQEPLAGGAAEYYTPDALGSVAGTSNSSGEESSSTSYSTQGAPEGAVGAQPLLGFTGALQDSTGLPYLHARELDPAAGAFLSADSVQPNGPSTLGYNLYAYASDDPATLTDPSGHDAVAEYAGLEGGLQTEAFNALYGNACKFSGKDASIACLKNCKAIFSCLVQGGAASTFFPAVLRTYCVSATVLNNLASIAAVPAGQSLPANELEVPLGHERVPGSCEGDGHRGVPRIGHTGAGEGAEPPSGGPPSESAPHESGPNSGQSENEGEEEEEEGGEETEVEIGFGPESPLPCPKSSRMALRSMPASVGYLRTYRCR